MDRNYFLSLLYPFQDQVLRVISMADTEFHLTGSNKIGLSLNNAITGAQGKAIGVFPVDLARALCSVTRADWELVRWITPPEPEKYITQLNELGQSLIFP